MTTQVLVQSLLDSPDDVVSREVLRAQLGRGRVRTPG